MAHQAGLIVQLGEDFRECPRIGILLFFHIGKQPILKILEDMALTLSWQLFIEADPKQLTNIFPYSHLSDLSLLSMQLTEMKGYEAGKHVLACFGGAGPQHACSIARTLHMGELASLEANNSMSTLKVSPLVPSITS